MKKAAFFLAAAIIFLHAFSLPALAATAPAPVGDIYVQDFSGVLTSEQKAELIQLGRQLEDGTTAQIAVLTVPSTEGRPIEEYSNQAFRQYGLGSKRDNNGVLLVVTTKGGKGERHFRVEVGYGLEGALPDGKVGRILDEYGYPYLENEAPAEAIMNTYKALYNETAAEYDWDGHAVEAKPYYSDEGGGINPFLLIVIAVIVIFLDMKFFGGMLTHIFLSILSRGGGGGGGNRGGGGGSSGGGGAGRNW
ncbi:TPM domain-containing protein [Bacillus aerolatus]|uniref:TPM domain-containing protein n=2 Tax=Bacillus aerolatus TaxID=2653354 RepID=A0A6I1FIC4_9BACI|nr:TPM domain-containing protein [Bacillus aerolatus]KAB7705404.1 TPM domain-containing protein [Bacillus aerolatus]